MIGSLEHPPIVIRSDRRKMAVYLLLALGLIGVDVIDLTIIRQESGFEHAVFVIGLVLFGGGGLRSLWRILFPSTLTLSPEGMINSASLSMRKLAWTDVTDFELWRLKRTTMVAFDFTPAYRRNLILRWINRKLAGVEGTLSPGWELDPAPLRDLLNDARKRWGSSGK